MIPPKLAELVDAAAVALAWVDYERPLFDWLERTVGFDVAFCVRADGIGSHAPGLDPNVRRQTAGRIHHYAYEYEAMKWTALERGGAAIDLEFFGRAALQRTRTYRDIIQPHRGRSSLLLFIGPRTLPLATVVLGRTGSEFPSRAVHALAAARSLLTVCELAIANRQVAVATALALSPRERELVQYLRLGYTNREIALACGTSFRTVRNQLSHLFQKLDVSTRSEAVARSFGSSPPLSQ
jgi:DNA-binding CsgD family transcriptional regulator